MDTFSLQLPKIENAGTFNRSDESIGEAIESIFYHSGDCIFMHWNRSKIRISLESDLSCMWEDVKKMMDFLGCASCTKFTIDWPSSSFFATWDFEKKSDVIKIKAEWGMINGGLEAIKVLKDDSNELLLNLVEYVAEWNKVIDFISEHLRRAGYHSYGDRHLD